MSELRKKMMLTLFGLMSALVVLLVGILDFHEYESTRQSMQNSLASLVSASNIYAEEEKENVALIYENPAWVVRIARGGQLAQIWPDAADLSTQRAKEWVVRIVTSQRPKPVLQGNLLKGPFVWYYPNDSIMILVDVTGIRAKLWGQFAYSFLLAGGFEVLLYFVCRRLISWMIAPMEKTMNLQKQFIADASHELKTPIAAIQANAEAMASDPDSKWLANIQEEARQMNTLVAELLDLARTDALPLEKSPLSLSKIVERQALIQEARIFEAHLSLEENIEPDLSVNGQSAALQRVVSILIDNAIAHSSRMVKVTLEKQGKEAMLKVGNTGVPIPPEDRENIFERFYRGDASRAREAGRYGLGLAIARSIVHNHQGKISVECQDGWTTFICTFPLLG